MRLHLRTDDRGRLVATVSTRPGKRLAGSAAGAASGALGTVFVVSAMSAAGRWWLVPAGLAALCVGGLALAAANRVDRWVFDGGSRRVERHRAALVPLEPTSWPLDDVLEVQVETEADGAGDVVPGLKIRLRSGRQIAMFDDRVDAESPVPVGGAAAAINEFLGAFR